MQHQARTYQASVLNLYRFNGEPREVLLSTYKGKEKMLYRFNGEPYQLEGISYIASTKNPGRLWQEPS